MRSIGILWENAASDHLQRTGLELIARNYSCRYGEIDLIMLDKGRLDKGRPDKGRLDKSGLDRSGRESDCLVFVEVRYRGSAARGDGAASVGASKRTKLIRAAAVYLQTQPRLAGLALPFRCRRV